MIDLTGKTALISGSSRGIGKASALRLADAGADVIVNYVSSRKAALETAQAVRDRGGRAFIVKADVSEAEDVASMMEWVQQHVGKLDIVVSNAASGGFRPLLKSNSRHFANSMNTNALALIHLVKGAMPMLERSEGRAKVIAISSHGSHMALPMYGLIGGSKAALESIARHLTLEVGDRGVNVNVVKAGLVETDSTRMIPDSESMFAQRQHKSMMGQRDLEVEDVADVVLFLASPLSDLVQGETITVDGGAANHV